MGNPWLRGKNGQPVNMSCAFVPSGPYGCDTGATTYNGFDRGFVSYSNFLDGMSRASFMTAMDISAYSFAAMGKAARPLMKGRNAAMLTLTYLGAVRALPNYNTMGVAKAALEANVRYMAASLGPEGTRVNGISAGPIKTLAASGIAGFSTMLKKFAEATPLRRGITADEVGNVAAFLMSDWASAMTGEILYVDNGFSHMATGLDDGGEKPKE